MAQAPVTEEKLSRADIAAALLNLSGEGAVRAYSLFATFPDSHRFVDGHHIEPGDATDLPIGADLAEWSREHAGIPLEGIGAHTAALRRHGREQGQLCVLLSPETGPEFIYTEAFRLFEEHEAEIIAGTRRRLELESEVERERERFRALLDASADAIAIIRRESGRIQYANAGFEQLAETSAEDAIGKSLWQLDTFVDNHLLLEAFRQAVPARRPVPLRLTRKNAATVALNLCTASVDFETYCVVLTDISDSVSSRNRLLEGEKNRIVHHLLGKLVHDIANSLTAITGFAQILGADAEASDGPHDSVHCVVSEARHARELVQQLTEVVTPAFRPHAPVNIGDLMTSAADLATLSAAPGGIEILTELGDEIPTIKGDRHALLCALDEAIVNAVDTLREAGKSGSVVIRARTEPKRLVVEVEDNAGGVPDVQKAFEPFYTTRNLPEHLGLGLNMIRSIAESHRGCATLHNTESGAILRITLAAAE
ncbi:MAG: ATP-binding protein [Planctomycetes bacterium]|nr:ATP-binding protein [Planctomycetota bacterium]